MKKLELYPILKWLGGKRQLIKEIESRLPSEYGRYYEPFLGGASVLFAIQPKKAIVNDINPELINLYEVLRDNVDEFIEDVKQYENTSDDFYRIRAWDREDSYTNLSNAKKASRIYYLNRTCYRGVFRVNTKGQFNTPYGNYTNPTLSNDKLFKDISKYLNKKSIKILNKNYKDALKGVKKGDFVYLDPPYMPLTKTAFFTGYTKDGFSDEDHIELKELCDELTKKGVKFLLSNSTAPLIKELYSNLGFKKINSRLLSFLFHGINEIYVFSSFFSF